MLRTRTLIGAVLALLLVAGVAMAQQEGGKKGKRAKGHAATGKFVSFTDGTLTLQVTHKKKGQEPTTQDRTFKIPDGTPVMVFKGEGKPEKLSAPEALKDVPKDTTVRVVSGADKSITRVVVNPPKGKKGGKKKGG